jgi:hypothetical protein
MRPTEKQPIRIINARLKSRQCIGFSLSMPVRKVVMWMFVKEISLFRKCALYFCAYYWAGIVAFFPYSIAFHAGYLLGKKVQA